jgi:hypothetical protein
MRVSTLTSTLTLMLCALTAGCAHQQPTHEVKAKSAGSAAAGDQCKMMLASPELDPIRNKIELYKPPTDGPPPFEIASNDTFPTEEERALIAKWASMRDSCIKRQMALLAGPASANAQQDRVFQQELSFAKDTNAHLGELIVALAQQKLTYGEFAQKRYWLSNEGVAAERAYRQSVMDLDEQRQLQVQQQFANALTVWGNYIQALNARPPRTVYLNGSMRAQ